jgi:hypothetical protein
MSINKINGSASDVLSKVNGTNDALLCNMLQGGLNNANAPMFNSHSVLFNGSSNYLVVDTVAGNIDTDKGTYSTWIKFNGATSINGQIIKASVNSNNQVSMVYHNSSQKFYFTYKAGGTTKRVEVATTEEGDGNWTHLAQTWDTAADELKGYVNGSQVASTVGSLGTFSGTINKCYVGRNTLAANSYVKGYVDEVGVWDEVLDDDAITAVYNSGKGINLTRNVGNYDNANDLIAYWKMEENTGTSIVDSSGNSNTGTLSHSSLFSTITI